MNCEENASSQKNNSQAKYLEIFARTSWPFRVPVILGYVFKMAVFWMKRNPKIMNPFSNTEAFSGKETVHFFWQSLVAGQQEFCHTVRIKVVMHSGFGGTVTTISALFSVTNWYQCAPDTMNSIPGSLVEGKEKKQTKILLCSKSALFQSQTGTSVHLTLWVQLQDHWHSSSLVIWTALWWRWKYLSLDVTIELLCGCRFFSCIFVFVFVIQSCFEGACLIIIQVKPLELYRSWRGSNICVLCTELCLQLPTFSTWSSQFSFEKQRPLWLWDFLAPPKESSLSLSTQVCSWATDLFLTHQGK